ncbi:hypothetical protein [Halosimplex marinum]|uniref:hypothetical protein n=1 Tax=Halosimplex marinum TaxID=3396620 RepID=UPI003F574542
MTQQVDDEWTQVLSENHSESTHTVEIDGNDVWLYKSPNGARPNEPEKGVTGRANETVIMRIDSGVSLFARCKVDGEAADVRVVGGYAQESTGRASVKADLVGTPGVDVSDDTDRDLGRVSFLLDGNPVDDTNVLPTATPNQSSVHTDSVSGDGSMTAQSVPDGFAAAFKADPSNTSTVYVDGYPLAAGEGVSLAVDDVSTPNITADDANDTTHVIVEVA